MEVGNDYQKAADLNKERSDIEAIVEKAREYREALKRLEEARALSCRPVRRRGGWRGRGGRGVFVRGCHQFRPSSFGADGQLYVSGGEVSVARMRDAGFDIYQAPVAWWLPTATSPRWWWSSPPTRRGRPTPTRLSTSSPRV